MPDTLTNYGTAGSALDATLGSTGSADANDPTVLAHSGTNYIYFPGAGSNNASVPDSAPLSPTGDVTFDFYIAPDDGTPGSVNTLIAKDDAAGSVSYLVQILTNGKIRISTSPDGTTGAIVNTDSTVTAGLTDLADKWLRAAFDCNDGAGNRRGRYYLSDDGETWTIFDTATVAGATTIFDSGSTVAIGRSPRAGNPFSGKMYRARIFNSDRGSSGGGTPVLDADFTANTSQSSFTESSSNAATVTITRATSGRKTVFVNSDTSLLGTDDYYAVTHNAALSIGTADSATFGITLRQWATLGTAQTVAAKRAGTAAGNVGWSVQGQTTTTFRVSISDGADVVTADSPAITLGDLIHLAWVLDRDTQLLTVYVNGVAGTPVSTAAIGSLTNAEELRVGRLSGAGTDYGAFEAKSPAQFWRRALSATELMDVAAYYGL